MHCAVSSDCSFCIALNEWVVYYCDISYHVAHTHTVCAWLLLPLMTYQEEDYLMIFNCHFNLIL